MTEERQTQKEDTAFQKKIEVAVVKQGKRQNHWCCVEKSQLAKLIYETSDEYDLEDFLKVIPQSEVTMSNSRGETPLHIAVTHNKPTQVLTLLKHGASPNIPDNSDRTPLMLAASIGSVEILQILIKHGAQVDAKTSREETALMFAVCTSMQDAVAFLLQNKADPNAVSSSNVSTLIFAIRNGNSNIVKLLIDFGADIHFVDEFGGTALHNAARCYDTTSLKHLIEAKADLDVLDSHGDAPFVYAIRYNCWEALQILIDAGCDITNMDGLNSSALGLATLFNYMEVTKVLLDNGEDVDEFSYFGNTPLMLASFQGHVEIAKLFLERGADPNIVNKLGTNALHKALILMNVESESNRHKVVSLLLRYGTNPSLKVLGVGIYIGCPQLMTGKAACPMSLAIGTGYISLVRMLLIAGHDVGLQDLTEWQSKSLANNIGYQFYISKEMTAPIEAWICQPRPLLFLCRAAIRRLLPPSIPHSIEKLQIATSMKYYLNYGELDDIELEPVSILEETKAGFPMNYACSIRALKNRLDSFVARK